MTANTFEKMITYIQQSNRIPIDNELYMAVINKIKKEYPKNPRSFGKGNRLTQICCGEFWRKNIDCKNYNTIMSIKEFYNIKQEYPAQIRPVNRERTPEEDIEYKWLVGLMVKNKNIKKSQMVKTKRCLDYRIPHFLIGIKSIIRKKML